MRDLLGIKTFNPFGLEGQVLYVFDLVAAIFLTIFLLGFLYFLLNCLFQVLLPCLQYIDKKNDRKIIRLLLLTLVVLLPISIDSSSIDESLKSLIPTIFYLLGIFLTRQYLEISKEDPEINSPIHQFIDYSSFLERKIIEKIK